MEELEVIEVDDLQTPIIIDKPEHTFDEQMAIECVKKIKYPFRMLTVEHVMKDLDICRSIAYKLFQSENFPSKKIGKNHQVCLIAYLIWKVKKGI